MTYEELISEKVKASEKEPTTEDHLKRTVRQGIGIMPYKWFDEKDRYVVMQTIRNIYYLRNALNNYELGKDAYLHLAEEAEAKHKISKAWHYLNCHLLNTDQGIMFEKSMEEIYKAVTCSYDDLPDIQQIMRVFIDPNNIPHITYDDYPDDVKEAIRKEREIYKDK